MSVVAISNVGAVPIWQLVPGRAGAGASGLAGGPAAALAAGLPVSGTNSTAEPAAPKTHACFFTGILPFLRLPFGSDYVGSRWSGSLVGENPPVEPTRTGAAVRRLWHAPPKLIARLAKSLAGSDGSKTGQ
jgi:hypothetical protein